MAHLNSIYLFCERRESRGQEKKELLKKKFVLLESLVSVGIVLLSTGKLWALILFCILLLFLE